jgi:aerobic-type carbon monoxide dehydrogenase small subunit (CoxS/CutS family)
MSEYARITVTINGREWSGEVAVRTSLSDFIRYELELTGTHLGCEHGVCGACTVMVDGAAVRSCLMLAVQADGVQILTVESLATGDALSGFQQAMMEEHGLQCGFCTPGILMSVAAAEQSGVSAEEVSADVLDGHICRCTGYAGIRTAIRKHWAQTGGEHVAARAHGALGNGTGPGPVRLNGASQNGHGPTDL